MFMILQVQTSNPRFTGENLEKNKVIYNQLANLAAKHGYTPSQLALAWLLNQGNDIIPIPGIYTLAISSLNILKVFFFLYIFRVCLLELLLKVVLDKRGLKKIKNAFSKSTYNVFWLTSTKCAF